MEELIIIEDLEPEEILVLEEQIEYVAPSTQEKEVTPTEEEQIVKPDEGIFALSKVKVNPIPEEYAIVSGNLDITENGTYDVKNKETVKVNLVFNNTLEIENLKTDGTPENVKWYGEEIPNGALRYYNYSNNLVNLSRNDNLQRIGTSGLQNAYVNLSDDFLDEVIYIGEYGLAIGKIDTVSLSIPKWDGRDIDGTMKGSIFRINSANIKTTNYYLPSMQYVGSYNWYQNNRNLTVQIGSIGHGILQVDNRPFGSTSGNSNITCYTTGDKLDTISSALMSQAGANTHFTFKASEDTTYQGVSYQAGETMLSA